MIKNILRISCVIVCLIVLQGCRGWRSEKPAVHVNPNFDWQAKFKTQQLATKSPDGVVPWGDETSFNQSENRKDYLEADSILYRGKTSRGDWVRKVPLEVNEKLLAKGKEQYNIYCAVCHTETGDGTKSLISKRGWVVPDITAAISRSRKDGELYDVVKNGIRRMPGYGNQIEVRDRWAVVAYLRALQKAANYNVSDLSPKLRNNLE